MNRIKKILLLLLFPKIWLIIVLVPVSAALLIYAFAYKNAYAVLVYASYALSAYTLTVVCVRSPEIIKKIKAFINSNKFCKRYLNDLNYRSSFNLNLGLTVNVIYSVFKFISGIVYSSFWFGAEAVYYIVLSCIRILLVNKIKIEDSTAGWKVHRLCGAFLLLLNTTMSGIIIQILFKNETYHYNGIIIYATAAFTFWRLISSIIQVAKYHRKHSPVISAAMFLNLSASLMSLFALQTAMIAEFGADLNEGGAMNTATGIAVSAGVMCIAVFMLFRSNKMLTLKTDSEEIK